MPHFENQIFMTKHNKNSTLSLIQTCTLLSKRTHYWTETRTFQKDGAEK